MSEISLLTAILAGALGFLSPCVLPLVPEYLGRMSALRGEESPLL
ncbi:MAG: cytochrome c biogenesis protein CcdA, partial [Candidatus Limnocylindrus sp.]